MSASVVFSRNSRYAEFTPPQDVWAEHWPESRQGLSGRSRQPAFTRLPSKGVTTSTSRIRYGVRARR